MYYSLDIADQRLLLLPDKAVFWVEKKVLIIADIHLGKAAHFRKNGIPIPGEVNKKNLSRIDHLMEKWEPLKVIFLGDLYHSEPNPETSELISLIDTYKHMEFVLTVGNHDLIQKLHLHKTLKIVDQEIIPPFLFRHIPEFSADMNGLIEICGHIHPSTVIPTKGRQKVRLPAFVQFEKTLLLPAFGEFTGTHKLELKNSKQFVIVDDQVITV